MKTLGIFTLAVVLVAASEADSPTQSAEGPRAAVDQLFRGMRSGSDGVVRDVLAPGARFSVLNEDGTISAESMEGWLRAVAASQGAWDEQIYDVEVRVDGALASVWAPYTFYLAGSISHCGVDSFELLRGADGWKITQVSDTRRTEGCPDPLGAR